MICLTQQVQGGSCPLARPPLAIALEWRWLLLFPAKMTLVTHKHCLVLRKSRTPRRHRSQRSLFSPMPIKNSPLPPPLSPFYRPLTLTCIVCAPWVFLKQHVKEIIWKEGYCREKCAQTNKWIHTPMYWYKVGAGGGGAGRGPLVLSFEFMIY